jgi:anti-anti-sigma factor
MLQIAPGWQLSVEHGPDWIFVRFRSPSREFAETPPLADGVWELLEQRGLYRVIFELDELEVLCSSLIGQLVLLHKRVSVHGGTLRVCGLSPENQQVLRLCRLDDRFPPYRNRGDAVVGHLA